MALIDSEMPAVPGEPLDAQLFTGVGVPRYRPAPGRPAWRAGASQAETIEAMSPLAVPVPGRFGRPRGVSAPWFAAAPGQRPHPGVQLEHLGFVPAPRGAVVVRVELPAPAPDR